MSEKTVTITESEYNKLLEDSEFLDCLRCCGVDNWCGYGDAREMLESEDEEQ